MTLAFSFGPSLHAQTTGAVISGTVDEVTIDDAGDVFSGGTLTVGGQVIIVPRNLLIDLPANRLTLQQLFTEAPLTSQAIGRTGLAVFDGVTGSIATVLGNRTSFGNVIAGDVFIEKGAEVVNGTVTYIDYTDGYLRIDGIVGDPLTGEMVRINDPESRYTIQQGLGCTGGPNCSPDPRFGVDPDNYTITFSTGYPAGIPSTVPAGQRPGFQAGDDPAAAANASGVGDPFCPQSNRDNPTPVPDSTRFAPIRVGDTIAAEGNFEHFGDGQRFLSCHTMTVFAALTTRNDPTQPDYLIFDEVEWDVPPFANQRSRLLLIGFTTLGTSQVDIFSLQVDPTTNADNEVPLASTVGNPDTVNQGIGATAPGIFKIRYDVDFLAGVDARGSPCQNLENAGLPSPCSPGLGTLDENMAVVLPISREIIGRTRRTLAPGVTARDINGRPAQSGEYLTPVGIGHAEFVEINLAALNTPFSFDGLPWNLDRRLGPGGCDGGCEGAPQPLVPFPDSGIDPAMNVTPTVRSEIFAFYPFGAGDQLAWPPLAPVAFPIGITRIPPRLGLLPAAPVAGFDQVLSGTTSVTAAFTNASTDAVASLWDFGDGTFSIEQSPVHVYSVAGTYSVTLTALGGGGTSSVVKSNLVVVDGVGGPGAPTANFSGAPTAGDAPLAVDFTDLSAGDITSWSWTFGDGTTSTAQNPSHVYVDPGSYTVSLTVAGPGGSDTRVVPGMVNATTVGGLEVDFVAVGATTGPAPFRLRVRAVNVTGVATSGTFDFGDGGTATVGLNNGRAIHTYDTPGVYTVTLTATDGTNTDVVQKVGFVTVTP